MCGNHRGSWCLTTSLLDSTHFLEDPLSQSHLLKLKFWSTKIWSIQYCWGQILHFHFFIYVSTQLRLSQHEQANQGLGIQPNIIIIIIIKRITGKNQLESNAEIRIHSRQPKFDIISQRAFPNLPSHEFRAISNSIKHIPNLEDVYLKRKVNQIQDTITSFKTRLSNPLRNLIYTFSSSLISAK